MKTLKQFVSESQATVQYTPLDGINRTDAVDVHDYPTDANKFANGGQETVNPTDIVGKIVDPEVIEKLRQRYGPDWREVVSDVVAALSHNQPNSHIPGRYQ